MKKIFKISTLFVAALAGLSSCDLHNTPEGAIDPDNAMESLKDAIALRDGLYIAYRGSVTGSLVHQPEIQSDLMHATLAFGNNGGDFYEWTFQSANGTTTGWWGSMYSNIAQCNFFIQKANLVDKSNWRASAADSLQQFKGEAFFMRAYYHSFLLEKFCLPYPGNETSYGVPYVTSYNPTSDQTLYPSRGTQEEAYTKLIADLDSAESYIKLAPKKGSIRLTTDAVKALRARVALTMGDYATAISNAKALIDGKKYPLCTSADALKNMFLQDSGEECIVMLDADYATNSLPASNSFYYMQYNSQTGTYNPYYVPEKWVVEGLYTKDDLRFPIFFLKTDVDLMGGSSFNLYIVNKFSGNDAFKSGDGPSEINKAKPFRIAEQYLILAEAYAKSGNSSEAVKYLNELQNNRGGSLALTTASIDDILKERVRELFGEGFRISDLKRNGKDMKRGDAQIANSIYLPSTYQQFSKTSGDHRFLWPIPKDEIDANPNIKGQQNEGF